MFILKLFFYVTNLINIFTCQQLTPQAQSQQQQLVSNVCQSGIREDNTNYIYCARRSLTEIPLFSKNNVVYDELVLTDNRIKSLDSNSFTRIKVKKIYLNGNPINFIDEKAFSKLENHLEELWLDADSSNVQSTAEFENESIQSSSIVGIPKSIVNYLRNLNTLRLKGLYVKTLENFVFKKLKKVQILSLQFCSIQKIELNAFEGLSNSITELYLDGNLLQSIPTEALINAAFTSLKILGLSQNNIKIINVNSFGFNYFNNFDYYNQIRQESNSFNNLVKLDLSYNGLKKIDSQAFNHLNNTLESFMLQNNEINSYNLKFLHQLNALKDLNLGFNLITNLKSNLFKNSLNLQFLSLQGNSIVFDTEDSVSTFDGLIGLQRLNLARNGIKYLPSNLFKPLVQLKSLIIDKNIIENLNEFTFEGLFVSLMNISLQNTKMNSENLICLKHFERIERIKLGFNEIKQIDWSLFEKMCSTLTNLDLQNNQIESIIYEINSRVNLIMENLQELDFSNNKLCHINSNLINKSPKLKNLGLSQNPLYCDCNMLPLFEWVRRKFDKDMISFIQWQCEVPTSSESQYPDNYKYLNSNSKYQKFTSLSIQDFICNSSRPSRCSQIDENSKSATKVSFTNSIKSSSSSSQGLNSKKDLDPDYMMVAPTLAKKITARISNIQLKSIANTVHVEWELDQSEPKFLTDIQGFKINYNKLKLDEAHPNLNSNASSLISSISSSSAELSTSLAKSSLLVDKHKRNFVIEDLEYSSRYTICVSILRYQGYDKYCRDIETKKDTKSKSSSTKKLINSMNLSSVEILANKSYSNNFISTLMIAILTVLICFILGLIAFIFVYVRKCKRKTAKTKSLMSTINSRRDYTGATLTDSSASSLQADSFEQKFNLKNILESNHSQTLNCCNCDTLIKLNNNDHFQNHGGLVTINNRLQAQQISLANQKYYQIANFNPNEKCSTQTCNNPNICNCLQLGGATGKCNFAQHMTIGDTSTVSSTLSSVKPNEKSANDIEISPNQQNQTNHEHTSWNFCQNSNQGMSKTSPDMSSSPTSFTHFVIPQNNQQQIPIGYLPYELYNCIQNNSNTLILPPIQQQLIPFITNSTNTNSKKISSYEKSKIISNQQNFLNMNSMINQLNNANSDHVYCEIPSTLNRCNTNNQQSSNFKNSHINSQQNNINHHTVLDLNHQNTSTSLLLSSSSSSSSSTSPQSNSILTQQNSNSKFMPPSII